MTFKLPPHPVDAKLVSAFGGDVYAIGGRVRDELLREMHGGAFVGKDLDYVITNHTFEDVRERLQRLGRLDEVGASFAVMKATIDGVTVDVALPRREHSTGPGHRDFSVHFGPEVSLRDDMVRRDFTINMTSYRLCDGKLITAEGALDDLRARRLRILSEKAFLDDPLRMWRAVQFAARFDLTVEARTLQALKTYAHLATTLPAERISEEISKLLVKSQKPSIGLELARDSGLLHTALPELLAAVGVEQNPRFHEHDVWSHMVAAADATEPTLIHRIAALFHDVGKPATQVGTTFYGHESVGSEMAKDVLQRLRFPSGLTDRVTRLIANHMYVADVGISDGAKRRFIRRVGEDNLSLQFALRRADVAGRGPSCFDLIQSGLEKNALFERSIMSIMEAQPALNVKQLPLNGRDVISFLIEGGYKPGDYRGDATVGLMLERLLDDVTERPEINNRHDLMRRMHVHGETLAVQRQALRL